ncbi:MAG: energy transducer TonB [Bacteroidota bacterium]
MNTTTLSTIFLLCLLATSFSLAQTTASIGPGTDYQVSVPTVEIRDLHPNEHQQINRPISNSMGTTFNFHNFFAATVQYPELATNNAMEGTVTLRLWVGSNGTVKILGANHSGYNLLDNAVLEAAEQLPALRPALIDGQAIGQLVLVPVHFFME